MRHYLNGYIPEKIRIVSGTPQKFSWSWDNYTISRNYQTDQQPKLMACRAFVCDASESKQLKSALHQATSLSHMLAPDKKNFDKDAFKPDVLHMVNAGITDVRVVGVEGYANKTNYCVSFLEDKYCFEIESDALMDAITIGGIEGAGHLKGEFVFVRVSGKMKLIRVGSAFHRACVEANERRKSASIDKFELVPGKVYKTKTGSTSLFLGFVNTVNLTVNMSAAQKKLTQSANSYSPQLEEIPVDWNKGVAINNIPWKMATLWLDVWSCEQPFLEGEVKKLYDSAGYDIRRVVLRKSHTFIEEMPDSPCVDVDIQAVFESYRQSSARSIEVMKSDLATSLKAVAGAQGSQYQTHTRRFSKTIPYATLPNLSFDDRQKLIGEFNKAHEDELLELTKFFLTLNYEEQMLLEAPGANMIVYGMPPVVNPDLQKIMVKYNGNSL